MGRMMCPMCPVPFFLPRVVSYYECTDPFLGEMTGIFPSLEEMTGISPRSTYAQSFDGLNFRLPEVSFY